MSRTYVIRAVHPCWMMFPRVQGTACRALLFSTRLPKLNAKLNAVYVYGKRKQSRCGRSHPVFTRKQAATAPQASRVPSTRTPPLLTVLAPFMHHGSMTGSIFDRGLELLARLRVVVGPHELHELSIDAQDGEHGNLFIVEQRVAVGHNQIGCAQHALAEALSKESANLALGVRRRHRQVAVVLAGVGGHDPLVDDAVQFKWADHQHRKGAARR
eukprot:3829913-Prymnesium_polylepis.1